MRTFLQWVESKWSSFRPGRQREFPFQHDGYNRKATSYLDTDIIDPEYEEDTDFNLYHVTSNLAAVKVSGRLKSRRELGITGALGGGGDNEAPGMVSTTYDYNRAREIYSQMKLVAEMCRGQFKASQVWDMFDDAWDNQFARSELKSNLPNNIYKKLYKGEIPPETIDQYIKTPKEIYEFFQNLEDAQWKYDSESDSIYHMTAVGFTAPFEDMIKIDPNQVAIIQVVARKEPGRIQHVNLEKEVRFKPEDLRIVRYYQP